MFCLSKGIFPALTAILLSLSFAYTNGLQYAGTQCLGAVDFPLKADTDVETLDILLSSFVQSTPPWLTSSCQDANRRIWCGRVYSPEYNSTASASWAMCASQCNALADACRKATKIDEELSIFFGAEFLCSESSDDPNSCVEVGTLDESLMATPACPSPLVVTEEHPGREYEGYVLKIPGTACAVPCPVSHFLFGEDGSNAIDTMFYVCSGFGFLCGIILLFSMERTGSKLYSWYVYISY